MRLRSVFSSLLYVLLGAWTTYASFKALKFNAYFRALFLPMIHGTAYRPYVYRALLGWLLRAYGAVLPAGQRATMVGWGRSAPFWAELLRFNGLKPEDTPLVAGFVALSFVCFTGFVFCLAGLFRHFYPDRERGTEFWTTAGVIVGGSLISWKLYLYDPGTWLLFPLCLLLMARRRWGWFWLAWIAATLNKETTLLLLPVLWALEKGEAELDGSPLRAGEQSAWTLHARSFIALGIWLTLELALKVMYRHNPGGALEFHLVDTWTTIYTPVLLTHFMVLSLAMGAFAAYGWWEKPVLLRVGLLWSYFPMAALMTFFGVVFEVRDYYEVFPFAYLLGLPALWQLAGKFGKKPPLNPA